MHHPIEYCDHAWNIALEVLQPTKSELERGLELHRTLTVCDGYGFSPVLFSERVVEKGNALLERGVGTDAWRQKLTAARQSAAAFDPEATRLALYGLNRAGVSAIVQPVGQVGDSPEHALMFIAAHQRLCTVLSERYRQGVCAADIAEAKRTGKTALIFSLTGFPLTHTLAVPDDWFDWLDVWYGMGVRLMHLSYNRRNAFADGCTEEANGGLSDLGRELVARLNATGIIVDAPHTGKASTLEAARLTTKPMMASHIGCEAIHSHPRCKSDEEIKAIAGTGGMVGIYAIPNMLGPNANLNTLFKHLQHVVKLVGEDHVGIGTDTNYCNDWPENLRLPGKVSGLANRAGGWKPQHQVNRSEDHRGGSLTWTNWPLYIVGLVQCGFSDEAIAKIVGGNLCRVLEANRPEGEKEVVAVMRETV